MKMLTRENIPCWYEVSWQEEGTSILIRIHPDMVRGFETISVDAPIAASLMEQFDFHSFEGSLTENFGFNQGLQRQEGSDGFVEFVAKIPTIRRQTQDPCEHCGGSGKWYSDDDECASCDGSGKEHTYEWWKVHEISASLTVLLTVLEYLPEQDSTAEFPQLLTVTTITRSERSCGIWGTYSPVLSKWLTSLGANAGIPEMVQAMKIAHESMLGVRKYLSDWDFRANIADQYGWLNVDCPGDACCLHPALGSPKDGEGYEFTCHNVDTPAQQLTLLAGLAALHDRVRKELATP